MDHRIERLRYLLREDPSSRVFCQLAQLLRKADESQQAAELLERGLDRHPRYVAAWVELGRVRKALGDMEGAGSALTRALEIDPQKEEAVRLLAEIEGEPAEEPQVVDIFTTRAIPIQVARAAEVFQLSDGDPFLLTEAEETVIWDASHDVFTEQPPVVEYSSDAPPEERESLPASAPTPAMPEVVERPRGVPPLPTITLARLALQQGDFELAKTTLRALLDRNPEDAEAAQLLEQMTSGELGGPLGRAAAKVGALQAWLDTIRLASERRSL